MKPSVATCEMQDSIVVLSRINSNLQIFAIARSFRVSDDILVQTLISFMTETEVRTIEATFAASIGQLFVPTSSSPRPRFSLIFHSPAVAQLTRPK